MTVPESKSRTVDRAKFKALMLYFSKRGIEEGLVIGSTKLNKLLFFTDFEAYARLGHSITHAQYQRLKHGPAARALVPLRDELVSDHLAHFRQKPTNDLNDVLVPDADPDLRAFSKEELEIADAVFEELRPYNATEVSDYSHLKSAGWRTTPNKANIPYASVFIKTDPPSPEAFEIGRKLAAAR